jgi:hypothetical protein
LLLFFFAFFLVAMDLFSLSILHGICNGVLLQLNECIESTQIEVKEKMITTCACNGVPKLLHRVAREKSLRDTSDFVLVDGRSSLVVGKNSERPAAIEQ